MRIFLLFLLLVGSAHAEDFHICNTPLGTGDASSPANCGGENEFNSPKSPGDNVFFYTTTGLMEWEPQFHSGTGNAPAQRIFYHNMSRNLGIDFNITNCTGTPTVDMRCTSSTQYSNDAQMIVFERDIDPNTGEVLAGEDSRGANLTKPFPGNVLGTGNEIGYWNRNIGGNREDDREGNLFENGEVVNIGGTIHIRTSEATDPRQPYVISMPHPLEDLVFPAKNIRGTSSQDCFDVRGRQYITLVNPKGEYCHTVVDAEDSNGIHVIRPFCRYMGGFTGCVDHRNSIDIYVEDIDCLWVGSFDSHHYECAGGIGGRYAYYKGGQIGYTGHVGFNRGIDTKLEDIHFHHIGGKPTSTNTDRRFYVFGSRFGPEACPGENQLENAHISNHPCLGFNTDGRIFGFNEYWSYDSTLINSRSGSQPDLNWWAYHNTVHDINTSSTAGLIDVLSRTGDPIPDNVNIVNNLFTSFTTNNGNNCVGISYSGNIGVNPSNSNSTIEGNAFQSANGCNNYLSGNTIANYESNFPSNVANNTALTGSPNYFSDDPINANFNLNAGSNAIDTGVFLPGVTATCSGNDTVTLTNTTWIPVPSATAPWNPDNGLSDNLVLRPITIGSETGLRVIGISGSNVTVDRAVTCPANSPVSFDYTGASPDAGAHEFGGGNTSPPSGTNDTLDAVTAGYCEVVIPYADLLQNDTITGTSPTVINLTDLTPAFGRIVDNSTNSEFSIIEIDDSVATTFQGSYVAQDSNGESSPATFSMLVNSSTVIDPGTPVVPNLDETSIASTENSFSGTSGVIDYPPGVVSGESGLLMVCNRDSNQNLWGTPAGWTSLGQGDGGNLNSSAWVRVADAASNVTVTHTGDAGDESYCLMARIDGINSNSLVHDFEFLRDSTGGNNSEACQALVDTTFDQGLAICVGATDNDGAATNSTFTSYDKKFEGAEAGGSSGIHIAQRVISPAGAVPAETITINRNDRLHTFHVVFNADPETDSVTGDPIIFSDDFSETGAVALNAKSLDVGTYVYDAETGCTVDTGFSCPSNDGWVIPTGIADGVITASILLPTTNANLVFDVRGDNIKPTFDGANGGNQKQNSLRAVFDIADNEIKFSQRINGVSTTIGSTINVTLTPGSTINPVYTIDGNTVTFELDTEIQTFTIDPNLQGTHIGGRINPSTDEKILSLEVRSAQTPDTTAPATPVLTGVTNGLQADLTGQVASDNVRLSSYEFLVNDCLGGTTFTVFESVQDSTLGAKQASFNIPNAGNVCEFQFRTIDTSSNVSGVDTYTSSAGINNNQPLCEPTVAVDNIVTDLPTVLNAITLANVTDPDNDTVVANLIVTQATNGGVSVSNPNDMNVRYTSIEDYVGADSFTVRFSDGNGGTCESVFNLTVDPQPSGTRFVTTNSVLIINQQDIEMTCLNSDGDVINTNRVSESNAPYEIADMSTDASGVFRFNLYDGGNLSSGEDIFCAASWPDSTAQRGYKTFYALLPVQIEP